MEPKYKAYNPEVRYHPFCVNPCEGNYHIIDALEDRTVLDKPLRRPRAIEEADALNAQRRTQPHSIVTRLRTKKARLL